MSLAIVSPYHLTTRELPAMVGLALADEVVTFLPSLREKTSRETAEQAARDEPVYVDMLESWLWSMRLWEAGLLVMDVDGTTPDEQIREVGRTVQYDERYIGLRPLLPAAALDDDRVLRNVARDVLRGGPDPAISVPVAAGLDRFAALHDGIVMRSAATSVAQQAEARLGQRIFSCVLPMLIQASAGRMLEFRELMQPLYLPLTHALFTARQAALSAVEQALQSDWQQISEAWTTRFEEHREQLLRPCEDEDDLHVIPGLVSVTGVSLPADAVLRSSVAALRAISSRPMITSPGMSTTLLPAVRDTLEGRRVLSLVCKSIGRLSR